MRKNKETRNFGSPYLTSMFIGTVIGFLLIFVLFAVFSWLIATGRISEQLMKVLTGCAAFLGAAVGGFAAAKRYGSKLSVMGLSVGGLMLVITVIGALCTDSGRIFNGMTPILVAALLVGGLAGAFLNLKRKKRKHS